MVMFRVRAQSLSEVAALMGTVVTTFDANLASVNSTVTKTVGVNWVGEDAEKFQEGWTTFQAVAAALRQSLVTLQAGLIAADGSYTQTESGVQRTMTGRVSSVKSIARNTGSVGARVSVGQERADLIEEFFDEREERAEAQLIAGGAVRAMVGGRRAETRSDDETAVIMGATSRPTTGKSAQSGPNDPETAAAYIDDSLVEVDIEPSLVPAEAAVVTEESVAAQVSELGDQSTEVITEVSSGIDEAIDFKQGLSDLLTQIDKET